MYLQEKVAISMENRKNCDEEFIIKLAGQKSGSDTLLAAMSSSNNIRIYKRQNLTSISDIKPSEPDVKIKSIVFSNTNQNIVYTTCSDNSIRSWDIRTPTVKPTMTYKQKDKDVRGAGEIGVNASDTYLCASYDKNSLGDVTLAFWDIRNDTSIGYYDESFSDQITQIEFHETDNNKMIVGSMDGIVSLFDIQEETEEDALITSLNLEASINRTGFIGLNNEHIYATSHMDSICVWDGTEFDELYRIEDTKSPLKDNHEIDYVVDCFNDEHGNINVLTGMHSGELNIMKMESKQSLSHSVTMQSHKSDVRCLHYHHGNHSLVTGDEDSMLCLWSSDKPVDDASFKEKLKITKKRKRNSVYSKKTNKT